MINYRINRFKIIFILFFVLLKFFSPARILGSGCGSVCGGGGCVDFGPGHEVCYNKNSGRIIGCPNGIAIPGWCIWTNSPDGCGGGGGGGGGGGDDCETRRNSGRRSCSYWDTVDWNPVDTSTGTQTAIQVLRSRSCTWSCSYNTCRSRGCSGSCNPGCPPNDPRLRNAAVCGDNEVNGAIAPSGPQDLCPGITPRYPAPGPNDIGWTRDRVYQTVDPYDSEGILRDPSEYQCNTMDYPYVELICEECDDGFCGSDTCYGPVDGAAYACRWKDSNCGDHVFQPNGVNAEICDFTVHQHCAGDCMAWAECGDGEKNWPTDFTAPEECDDGKHCYCPEGALVDCTNDASVCADPSSCAPRSGDGCDSSCQIENQGGYEEVLQ